MKNTTILVLIILVLLISGCSQNNQAKYEACVEECNKLVGKKIPNTTSRLGNMDYSDRNKCKTVCIEKYK